MNKDILNKLCDRCSIFIKDISNDEERLRLTNMIVTLKNNYDWPDLKIGKWLGYIEGVLISNNLTTVNAEREFSREYYHEHYNELDINIPASTDVTLIKRD